MIPRNTKKEPVFWLDETDPKELLRRADDLRKEGLIAAADELVQRARFLMDIG